MDARLLSTTEKLMRDKYHLSSDYEMIQCNIKKSTIEVQMSNKLIPIRATIPRDLIESVIDSLAFAGQRLEDYDSSEKVDTIEEVASTNEGTPLKSHKKVKKRVK